MPGKSTNMPTTMSMLTGTISSVTPVVSALSIITRMIMNLLPLASAQP